VSTRAAAYRAGMGELIPFPAPDRDARPAEREPLWREAVGRELREERQDAGRTLADVAEQAGVSTQYLSEVERGRKEPSSEVLQAVAGALGLRLVDLTTRVARRLAQPSGPVCLAA
jgi:ribosome-binding protein aMBF1 (putative translation factor)